MTMFPANGGELYGLDTVDLAVAIILSHINVRLFVWLNANIVP